MTLYRLTLAVFLGVIPALPAVAQSTPPPASTADLPDAPSTTVAPKPEPVPTGPVIVIDTTQGRLTCKTFLQQAPLAVANFIGLAEGTKDWTLNATNTKQHNKRFYDGLTFHRVIPGFMIQGGDPAGDGTGDPGYLFKDEVDPTLTFSTPGRLAMANSGPGTNGSQFFITEAPQPDLDGKYSLFGQCDQATVNVVAAIARLPRNAEDKPLTPVVITHVSIVRDGQAMPPAPPAHDDPQGMVVAPGTYGAPTVGAGVTAPTLVYQVTPEFPESARRQHLKGDVKLALLVDENGKPTNVHVTHGVNPDLDEEVVEAVKQYRYKPALEDGKPVLVAINVDVNFQIF